MVEMGGFEPPFAACAPVSLTHGCSCRELQNAITTLPHLHEGGCRSFPAVTAACRLLAVSPDRYTFLLPSCALSPEARSACTSHEHWIWCRRLESNQRRGSAPGTLCALPTELRLHEGGARLSEPPANHVMAHRRFYVSRVLSVPKHTCSKENLMASLLGTSPCVRNYNIEA